MRIVLAVAVLALAGCGHHTASRSSCAVGRGPELSERTGEHSLSLTTSCGLEATPRVSLSGLPFAFVPEGGPKGSHVVVLDKYRCDIRAQRIADAVSLNGARLEVGRSLMDWCPAQAVSTVVHVYVGGLHARATWRAVLRDAYDGRVSRVYPCAVLRETLRHFPADSPTYSKLPAMIGRAASAECSLAVLGLPRGAPRFAVLAALGTPTVDEPRCPRWTWTPYEWPVDGARVCFAGGRATVVRTAVHG